ncbi:hypothetical protein [Deinococcus yunweiensis]|uniref:hypothetical protein n=1 Tax=Deinococcus yunweiensis TaxID=367282 RepID=UPI00398F3B2E
MERTLSWLLAFGDWPFDTNAVHSGFWRWPTWQAPSSSGARCGGTLAFRQLGQVLQFLKQTSDQFDLTFRRLDAYRFTPAVDWSGL